jgi:hypothetical protein
MASWLQPARADAQAARTLDHFWCYGIQGKAQEVPVFLRDQFDPAGALVPALVRNAVRFCNPVEKTEADGTVTEITNPEAHLKLYFAHTPVLAPARQVTVRNQFGRQMIRVFDPIILGVPSAKNTDVRPDGLDHFKCYRAYGPALRNRVVKLRDQFTENPQVTVRRAVAFCNPTEKRHGDVFTPIENPKGHLVCYAVTQTPLNPPRPFLNVDQFGAEQLVSPGSDILCVPSEKLSFKPIL